jgi:solute carrier family 13 (sodium-dependent dicarboxylate transporter), member 2/3/5
MPTSKHRRWTARHIGLLLGPLLFVLTQLFFHPPGMSPEARAIFSSTLWIAAWWVTEAIPIAATSLLPIVLFPLTGGLDIRTSGEAYGHPLIFLFMGGFIIAAAIEKWNLHQRIALNIIYQLGNKAASLILGFMLATALLSMFISNTATAVMMMPIGIAVAKQIATQGARMPAFEKALMLAIAYAASIGGVATIIGTPPNLVLVGVLEELYQEQISFAEWMLIGIPVSWGMLALCWLYLVRVAFPLSKVVLPGGKEEVGRQLQALGRISFEEKLVLLVFSATALAWILRPFLLNPYLPALDDTIIALCGALAMFLLPARRVEKFHLPRLLDWQAAVKIPWGIILLFGGGLALAEGFKSSGLAEWLAQQLGLLSSLPLFALLLAIVLGVNFLTEVTSNVATASMILPILAAIAEGLGLPPVLLMTGAALAASCAFMLPVATPPNAVVFGSGYLSIPDMVRAGFWLNLASSLIVALAVYFLLPLVWGL